ncbi:SPFH domain-containing protein [Luteipulveratus mongoliensis]|uniref:Band 7 domain-containing protein n=1 Tax=Luteipulveratus mongoliensis TaxID=571913 RepID=A0A0K1JNY4_9MICO|nr:SPFH domain-containing protein [Luteipulveratus mongoliensis]AKU18426.1 hypothetical protein VV02_25535 [Luteipulveratus mongoliensis]
MSLFHIIVPTRHARLVYKNGALLTVLESGRHRKVRQATYVDVDLREQVLTTAMQEVPTSDGLLVRATLALRWAVTDPVRFHEVSAKPLETVYLAAQIALRDLMGDNALEVVIQRGGRTPTGDLTAAVASVGERVGIDVLELVLKDVLMPSEIRAAATDLAAAKQRGQARLEEARAETAALRSMANGAQLLDRHPALAQLRLVQSLPPGARVSLQIGDADAPSDD